jgi:vitamin B12 transporter
MKRIFYFAFVGIVSTSTHVIADDNDPKRTEAYRLGEIVVRPNAPEDFAGENLSIVTQQEIKDKGARSLDEAVRAVPGVVVNTGPQGVPRIFIRGLPPRHTQIFLNGVPLNSSIDGQFDPSLVPTEFIDNVKIVQGVSSVLYGPGATAGIIDIITKKGTTGFHGDALVEAGDGGAKWIYSTLSGGANNVDYLVSGSYRDRIAYKLPNTIYLDNSDQTNGNFFANVGTSLGDWQFGLTLNLLKGDQGLPSNRLTQTASLYTSAQNFDRINSITGQSVQVDAGYLPGGPFNFRVTGYLNRSTVETSRYDDARYSSMLNPTARTFREIDTINIYGGQAQAVYSLGAFGDVTGGFLVRKEAATITGNSRDVTVRPTGRGGGNGGGTGANQTFAWRGLGESHDLTTTSLALEYRVDPIPNLHFTAGVSQNWFLQEVVSDNGVQWMGALAYDVIPDVQMFGSAARKLRFPTIDQLYNIQMGNPGLQPEHSDNFETGLLWRIPGAGTLRGCYFWNDVANFIQNDQTLQMFVNRNIDISGFQVSGTVEPLPALTLSPGYTHLQTRDADTRLPLDYRPADVVDLVMVYAPAPGWRVSGDLAYYASQSVGARTNPNLRLSLPDYLVVSAKLQKSFELPGPDFSRIDMYVRATNLFNASYENAVGFPAAGRTLYAGLLYQF